MKETYIKPRIEVITFEAENILTVSVVTDMVSQGINAENIKTLDVSDTSGWSGYTDTNN